MSLCPRCGNSVCEHTPDERRQSFGEVVRDLTAEEAEVDEKEPPGSPRRTAIAQAHAHDPVFPVRRFIR